VGAIRGNMLKESEDMISLNKFWHWSDNERPSRDLFDDKATAGGPLTDEAQEAMQQAVEVVGLRAPDVLHPSGEVLRPAIKVLSLAILQAWELLKENPMIVEALEKQETRDLTVMHFDLESNPIIQGMTKPPVVGELTAYFPGVPAPKPPTLNAILGRLGDFANGEEITMTYPDGTERKGTIHHQGMGVYDFVEHTGKAKDILERQLGTPEKTDHPGVFRANHTPDAVGYTAYNMKLPHEYAEKLTVDIKPLTIIPVIGEMGVFRDIEHDEMEDRLIRHLEPLQAKEHVSVRVDSRGILFASKEFPEINDLVAPCELDTCAGNGSIDDHKLYLIVNTLRHKVVNHKRLLQQS